MVEQCGEDTVACHVLGQTHCVSEKNQEKKGNSEPVTS